MSASGSRPTWCVVWPHRVTWSPGRARWVVIGCSPPAVRRPARPGRGGSRPPSRRRSGTDCRRSRRWRRRHEPTWCRQRGAGAAARRTWWSSRAPIASRSTGVGWGPVARPPGWSADRDQVLHLLADLHRAPPVPLGQDLLVGLGDQDRLLGAVHLPQRLVDLVPGEGLVELDAQVGEGDPVAVAAALAGEDRLVGGGDLGGDLVLRHAYSIARYTVTVKHA